MAIAHAIWDGKVRCAMKVSEFCGQVVHACMSVYKLDMHALKLIVVLRYSDMFPFLCQWWTVYST